MAVNNKSKLLNINIVKVIRTVVILSSLLIVGTYFFVNLISNNLTSLNKYAPAPATHVTVTPGQVKQKNFFPSPNQLISVIPSQIKPKNYFPFIPLELQTKDNSTPINPEPGFRIINSVRSNNNDRVVYSEVSGCDTSVSEGQSCISIKNWKYYVYLKNVNSKEKTVLWEYDRDKLTAYYNPEKEYANSILPMIFLPIAWSPNDKFIILKLFALYGFGSPEGTVFSGYAYIESASGKIKTISADTAQTLFTPDYNYAVFTEESQKSPHECGPVPTNYSSIAMINFSTGQKKTIIEELNMHYWLTSLSKDGVLTYTPTQWETYEDKNCLVPEPPSETKSGSEARQIKLF